MLSAAPHYFGMLLECLSAGAEKCAGWPLDFDAAADSEELLAACCAIELPPHNA